MEMDSNQNVIENFESTKHMHKRGRIPLVWAINMAPSNLKEAKIVEEALVQMCSDIPVLPTAICLRKVYRDASKEGKTIFEMPFKAREKAELELNAMFEESLIAAKQLAQAPQLAAA
jgi:hypothetical protein